jgi:hypothetical protein
LASNSYNAVSEFFRKKKMSIIKTPPINNISSKCFQCSCGKSYLNSTSLFTHNKLKHPSNVNLSNQPLHPINQNYTESKQKYS